MENKTIDTPTMCKIADDITFEVCKMLKIEAEVLEEDGEWVWTDNGERIYCKIYDIITNEIY